MKKIKVLLTLLVSMAIFGANAFANGSYGDGNFCFEDETITYSGSTATINVYVDKEAGLTGFGQDSCIIFELGSGLSYDESAQTTTGTYNTKSYWATEDGKPNWVVSSDITAWNTETDLLLSFVVGIEDPNGDLTINIDDVNSYAFDAEDGSEYVFDSSVKLTLVAEGPQGPVATKGETAANGITEYTVANDEDLADKKVMMSPKFENQTITEATRFVVTWNGTERKFGSDLYAKLGGQEGDITIGSLTFGLIVDDANANASDFTFAIN